MAITRREFVTRLGALAAAMGVTQVDLAKITEALAHEAPWNSPDAWTDKPKVVWVHGAECTGCSTSLLSLFEDVRGKAVEGATLTTLNALDVIGGGTGSVLTPSTGHTYAHRTLNQTAALTSSDFDNAANSTPYIANFADLLIDFIDLQYHETVGGAAGDLAYKWLHDQMVNGSAGAFVLVVEGAVQDKTKPGAWNEYTAGDVPWCSIGMDETTGAELSFDDVVYDLGTDTNCAAIIPIGQCACFGGYPGCVSPDSSANGKDLTGTAGSQTGATGVYQFFRDKATAPIPDAGAALAMAKVFNAPGCPTNPWWFTLTVVLWLVQFVGGPDLTARDKDNRIKAIYGTPLHGPYCTRYQDFENANFATAPGEAGCLQLLGCKGPSTMTLCGPHGWNSQQPQNDYAWEGGLAAIQGGKGGNCIAGGAPCMACTEKGYPDAFLPFIIRNLPNT